jgi:class 3 adenylate cyclase
VEKPRPLAAVAPARRPKRRSAAVLVLDVVAYGRQVAADPEGTLAAMRAGYRRIVQPLVTVNGGRIVKLMGDGVLAEFPFAAPALTAAVAIQQAFAMPGHQALIRHPLQLRAGLHVGEVIGQDSDIFGPTVNIAVRLEAAAPPGGILMSRDVCDHVDAPAAARLLDLGLIHLHHVDRPIHVVAAEIRPS